MADPPATIVQTPGNIHISIHEVDVLQRMFQQIDRVAIEAEFGMGLSGCRVFRVRPVGMDGAAHTPALVKIGPVELIQQEWRAYETWVKNRLPRIAWVTSMPIVPDGSDWGGLRCELVGGGIFEVQSLTSYYRQAAPADIIWVLQKRLFPIMGRSWWLVNRAEPTFQLQSDYDRLLPVNLMLTAADPGPDSGISVMSPSTNSLLAVQIGDRLRLQGFQVAELDRKRRMLTLNLPQDGGSQSAGSRRLRIEAVDQFEQYQVGDLMGSIEGVVTSTRQALLEDQARKAVAEQVDLEGDMILLPDGAQIPNPLLHYQKILHDTFFQVNLSTIHGDFNLENILVDPETRDVTVIDFATVRQGHALHDLLRIETEIITKLIPEALAQASLGPETIRPFYHALHQASFADPPQPVSLPHPVLEKPLAVLTAVRQEARKCFFNPEDHTEYYRGLHLYLLGALKFRNLDEIPNAKITAFFASGTVLEMLTPGFKPAPAPALGPPPSWPWRRLFAAAGLLILLAAAIYLVIIDPPAEVSNEAVCELDRQSATAVSEGPAAYGDLPAYFAAANPELYQHLDTIEEAYLASEPHKGLTYVWGAPSVGKSFVARNRLRDQFPGENCVIKLSDLFGDDSNSLAFKIAAKPDLISADGQFPFDSLPTVAESSEYSLAALLDAGGCRLADSLVPLIIVDGIDEVHTEASNLILRSLDRLILETDVSQQPFLHVAVLGRTEGFAPWYQNPKRNDDISPYLNTYWLHGPELLTAGDVEALAANQFSYTLGEETWNELVRDGSAAAFIEAYRRAVARHPFLTYSIRTLGVATMITDRAHANPDDTEQQLKSFLFEELIRRAVETHGRPLASDDQYLRALEEIAVKYAGADQVDDAGYFNVAAGDTVPLYQRGRAVGQLLVSDVLDHSGIAVLEPASYSLVRYRFHPVWVHAHLVELRNQRLISRHAYRPCY